MKILMVCLGNICRSPVAEGVMKHQLKSAGIEAIIDSAGTGSWISGEAPDKRSVANASKHGIDITSLRARQITVSDFETFDHIFVMDKSNFKNVNDLCENPLYRKKIKLLLSALNNPSITEVPDPYYGSDEGFETTFQLIEQGCAAIIQTIQQTKNATT